MTSFIGTEIEDGAQAPIVTAKDYRPRLGAIGRLILLNADILDKSDTAASGQSILIAIDNAKKQVMNEVA